MSLALWCGAADAQTGPNPSTPGYNVYNTSDPGRTVFSWQSVDAAHPLPVATLPTSIPGVTPVVVGSAANGAVLKAAPGNLYSVYAVCTAACWLMVFNSTTIPADGATTAGTASGNMVSCVPIGAGQTGSVNYGSGPPEAFSVGITAAISSTACATLTKSATAFIHGYVQ